MPSDQEPAPPAKKDTVTSPATGSGATSDAPAATTAPAAAPASAPAESGDPARPEPVQPKSASDPAPPSVSAADTDADADTDANAEVGAESVVESGIGHEDELAVRDAVSAPGPDGEPRRVTRRFPLFTRDTARPEGGGRAAPRDAPAPVRQWPILAVTGLVALGLLLTALDAFKAGTLLIGVALLAGAAMRWVLPDVGMLAVRSRFTDLVTYGVLGATIALLAMMAQPNPWLELPFLDDTLHFTIRT